MKNRQYDKLDCSPITNSCVTRRRKFKFVVCGIIGKCSDQYIGKGNVVLHYASVLHQYKLVHTKPNLVGRIGNEKQSVPCEHGKKGVHPEKIVGYLGNYGQVILGIKSPLVFSNSNKHIMSDVVCRCMP